MIEDLQTDDDEDWSDEQSGDGGGCTATSSQSIPYQNGKVDNIGPRHDPRNRQRRGELLFAEPPAPFNECPTHPCWHTTAEAKETNIKKREENPQRSCSEMRSGFGTNFA